MGTIADKKSIPWINAIKAVCIIFVFLAHSEKYYGYKLPQLDTVYLQFYVNAFFFVSGYLLFWKQLSYPKINESFSGYLSGGGRVLATNIFYRIVIPSIIFSLIEYIPACLILGRNMSVFSLLCKTIGGQTYWFTSALVVAEFIILLLLLTRRKNIWFYAIISMTIGMIGVYMAQNGITVFSRNWWAYRQGLIAVSFLAFGGLYWRYENTIRKSMRWWVKLILCVVFFATVFFCDNTNPVISTLSIEPLGVVTSLIACILLVELCRILPRSRMLTFIGQNSIGFYFMSGALPIVCSLFVHKLLPEKSVWGLVSVFVACLVIAYPVMKLLTRWVPWLFDLRLLKSHRKQEL